MRQSHLAFTLGLLCGSVALAGPGDVDPTFGTGGFVYLPDAFYRAIVAVPGSVEGAFVTADTDLASNVYLTKRMPDGSLDASFGSGGQVVISDLYVVGGGMMRVDGSGRILVAGNRAYLGAPHMTVLRLDPDGTPDLTFGTAGVATSPGVGYDVSLTIQDDEKILAAGRDAFDGRVARWLNDGTPDTSFGAGGEVAIPDQQARWVAQQSDGKLLVVSYERLTRLDTAGAIDTTLGTAGSVAIPFFPGEVAPPVNGFTTGYRVFVQADDKILVVALGQSFFNVTAYRSPSIVARYLSDGTLDPSYGAAGVQLFPTGTLSSVLEPTDTLVLSHTDIVARVRRVRADGGPESGFGTCGNANGIGYALSNLALQADGKILGVTFPTAPAQFVTRIEPGAADVSSEPDGDGDGIPDACDTCPDDPDPVQPDRDGDGVADACDPCTHVGERVVLKNGKLTVSKLAAPPGDEKFTAKGVAFVALSPPINPTTTGVRVIIAEAAGFYDIPAVKYDVSVPGGAYDPVSKVGWKANASLSSFKYKNAAGLMGLTGVAVKLGTKSPFFTKVSIKGKYASFPPGYPNLYGNHVVSVQLRPGSPNQCAYWDAMNCLSFSKPGEKLACKKMF